MVKTRWIRVDLDHSARRQNTVSTRPGYRFSVIDKGHPIGNVQKSSIEYLDSKGARYLVIENTIGFAGWDMFLDKSGATLVELSADSQDYLENYGLNNLIKSWDSKFFHLARRPYLTPKICFENAIFLFCSHSFHWGHCFQDLAFRLLNLPDSSKQLPLILDRRSPKNFLWLVEHVFGFKKIVLVEPEVPLFAFEALLPLPRMQNPAGWAPSFDAFQNGWGWSIDGPAAAELQQMRLGSFPPSKDKRFAKLYLARKHQQRGLENLHEIEGLLQEFGFRTVYLEDLDMPTTLRMLDSAETVVGVSGSQFLSCLLADPGLKCILLENPHQSTFSFPVGLIATGQKVLRVVGNLDSRADFKSLYERSQSSFRVETALLKEALSQF